ncbi:MAG: glycosyltransferase [Pseudomonadota bacterium]
MKALVVLGMHRSGTSLVARACHDAGITAGPAVDLLAAQTDNPLGFYEHRDLVRLNDAALEQAGGSWYQPPARDTLTASALPEVEPGKLLERLTESGDGQFLLKDPRLCLTWPLWSTLLEFRTLLFVYRAPLAVARSLARRHGFPLQHGILLWELYNRRALAAISSEPALAISYDAITASPEALPVILESLGAQGFTCEPGSTAGAFDGELHHFSQDENDTDLFLLSDEQRALHSYCLARCEGRETAMPTLSDEEQLLGRLRDLSAAFAPLATAVETARERDDAQALVQERTGERDHALSTLADLERDHRALADVHEKDHAEHKRLGAAHAHLHNEHNKLRAEFSALAAAHEAEVTAHEALSAEHAELREAHHVAKSKADYLFMTMSRAYQSLVAFERSPIGVVQRQLRRTYRLVTLRRGQRTAYEDVLQDAHSHLNEFDLVPLPQAPNKLRLLLAVLAYMRRNPSSSRRSVSWHRLRRIAGAFLRMPTADLAVWVEARFPTALDHGMAAFDPASLSPELDELELDFPEASKPRVSIIIPVYNDYRVTVNCLQTIHEHSGTTDYEIILADDCSTDLTQTVGERIRGIRVERTPENLRFVRNCNHAAKAARGDALIFLNNDTAVTEGWLEHLLKPLEDETVGVVGPKLLFADGKLQEAGGIVWDDASAWNFGRGDDPQAPAYSYVREVDYVSGACLLVRRSLWETLGGFDDRYAPAYYEDTDLCFAARDQGFRVLYQPESVVLHFEGVSHGSDVSSGLKQYQVTNAAKFLEKWREVLSAQHFPNGEKVPLARDGSRSKPCILVIDHYVPHFDKDAGGRSTYQYIQLLLRLGCRVQFIGANFFPHQPYTLALQRLGVEVLTGERMARDLGNWLRENAAYIDEVFLHRPDIAEQFLPHLKRMQPCPTISFVGHDLHHLRLEREAELNDDDAIRRKAEEWKQREFKVFEQVDRVYYFSDLEISTLQGQVAEEKLRRLPLYAMPIEELPRYQPVARHEILFVGGYNHPPNVDAAQWLVHDILPALREHCAQARVHLVGSNPTGTVQALAGDSVEVHGYLSDEELAALYRRIGVAVVPLRFGAGVKGKVIEAINHNVPLVTTPVGAEGIPEAETVMWVEESADALANRLAKVIDGACDELGNRDERSAWLSRHFSVETATEFIKADREAMFASRA